MEEKKIKNKKVSSNKDDEAKAKVQELLKNTSVANLVMQSEPKLDKTDLNVNEIKQDKSMKWLEEQIALLNKQIEDYDNEILFYKEEIKKMQEIIQKNNSPKALNNDLNPNLISMFRHFESVYDKGYTDAKIAHPESGGGILDVMLHYFPQLQNIKRYKYRG